MGAPEQLTFISQEWRDDRLKFRGNPVEPGWRGLWGNKASNRSSRCKWTYLRSTTMAKVGGWGCAFNKEVDNFIVPDYYLGRPFEGFTNHLPAQK